MLPEFTSQLFCGISFKRQTLQMLTSIKPDNSQYELTCRQHDKLKYMPDQQQHKFGCESGSIKLVLTVAMLP